MLWSDNRFKSTFHFVRTPKDPALDDFGPRYSLAFCTQPNADCRAQGPLKKYLMVTGSEFIKTALQRNFAVLEGWKAAARLKRAGNGLAGPS